jgi:hypothetical protein
VVLAKWIDFAAGMLSQIGRVRTDKRFDKIVWNNFDQTKSDPKGGGQDAWNNPSLHQIECDVAKFKDDFVAGGLKD